jgi:bifunctional DNA-binding transcriptional regulator/antitoxin component of YhaV-PrlF toxin-antitoxin module
MSEHIKVREAGEHAFTVRLSEGTPPTDHKVIVPAELRDQLGIADDDPGEEQRLVRESFAFLLEREPATSILADFSLDVIRRYFPAYDDEIARRLEG